MARLPDRFGYEKSTVHTAELTAMLTALRWRRRGQWNIFVGDRRALFDALKEAVNPSSYGHPEEHASTGRAPPLNYATDGNCME